MTTTTPDYSNVMMAIDTESEGLDASVHRILEISVRPWSAFANWGPTSCTLLAKIDAVSAVERWGSDAAKMHLESGLVEDLDNAYHARPGCRPGLTFAQMDSALVGYLATLGLRNLWELPIKQRPRILGRKPSHDMAFLRKYLPRFHACLSYREVDLVGIEALFRIALGDESKPKCAERRTHRAADDCEDAILAWEHYLHLACGCTRLHPADRPVLSYQKPPVFALDNSGVALTDTLVEEHAAPIREL